MNLITAIMILSLLCLLPGYCLAGAHTLTNSNAGAATEGRPYNFCRIVPGSNTGTQKKKEVKPLKGSAPFGVEKRQQPTGLNLDELLPKQVGPYTRTLLERSEQRGVTPTAIQVDGESVYATYKSGVKEIFVEFAISSTAESAQEILVTAAGDTTGKFPTNPRFGSLGTEPSYLRVNNKSGAFYAWTRDKYYFSASAKGGAADLDAFMQAFPY